MLGGGARRGVVRTARASGSASPSSAPSFSGGVADQGARRRDASSRARKPRRPSRGRPSASARSRAARAGAPASSPWKDRLACAESSCSRNRRACPPPRPARSTEPPSCGRHHGQPLRPRHAGRERVARRAPALDAALHAEARVKAQQIECWLSILARHVLGRGSFSSTDAAKRGGDTRPSWTPWFSQCDLAGTPAARTSEWTER